MLYGLILPGQTRPTAEAVLEGSYYQEGGMFFLVTVQRVVRKGVRTGNTGIREGRRQRKEEGG